MWIDRSISQKIKNLAEHFPALVLTGARQAGKTSLLRKLFPDYTYVSLDIPSTAELANYSPDEFISRYTPPLLVDEVQYAPALFRHLKVAIDRNRHAMGQFILTGSQKFTLMQSVADSLAGRRLHGKMIAIYGIAFEYKTSAPCGALEPKANPPRPAVAMIGAHRIGHQISPQVADAVTYTMTVRQGTI